MTRQLDPKDRSALRDLLLGAIEHCEISRHLIGTMVHTFYRDGVKYGIPAFTFTGPAGASNLHSRIGIIAGKGAGDRLSAEVTLELLERLLLQPAIAGNLTLRIAPILNPAGLEKPDSDATYHALSEERIRLQSPEGLIEIASIDGSTLHFTMRADSTGQQALEGASRDIHRLSGELDIRLSQTLLSIDAKHHAAQTKTVADPAVSWIYPSLSEPRHEPWELRIGIPKDWGANVSTQLTAQFLLCFFRHLERLNTERSHTAAANFTPQTRSVPVFSRHRYPRH